MKLPVRVAVVLLSILFAAPATGAELPPEILMDRLLLRAQSHIEAGSPVDALQVMGQALVLKEEHGIELPERFHFDYGRAALAAGQPESAIDHLNQYLIAAGRQGEQYRSALVLLETAEEALREQQAERERIEAEQRRIQTRLRTNEAQAQRQIEVSRIALPRDPLNSGGHAPEMVPIAEGFFEYSHAEFAYTGFEPEDVEFLSFDQPFAMSRYEVTVAEFGQFVNATRYKTEAERSPRVGCELGWVGSLSARHNVGRTTRNSMRWNRPGFEQGETHPVVCVSIRDAMAYTNWLSDETGYRYRLPSAAEWEYAHRAGSDASILYDHDTVSRLNREDCDADNLHDLDAHDEFNHADCRDGFVYSAQVGRFPPNVVGLHDLLGNVAELVMTCRTVERYMSGSMELESRNRSRNIDPEHPDRCGEYIQIMGNGFAGSSVYLAQRPAITEDEYFRYFGRSSRIDVGIRLVGN